MDLNKDLHTCQRLRSCSWNESHTWEWWKYGINEYCKPVQRMMYVSGSNSLTVNCNTSYWSPLRLLTNWKPVHLYTPGVLEAGDMRWLKGAVDGGYLRVVFQWRARDVGWGHMSLNLNTLTTDDETHQWYIFHFQSTTDLLSLNHLLNEPSLVDRLTGLILVRFPYCFNYICRSNVKYIILFSLSSSTTMMTLLTPVPPTNLGDTDGGGTKKSFEALKSSLWVDCSFGCTSRTPLACHSSQLRST